LNVMAVEAGVENQETVSLIADLLSIRGDHRNPPSNVSPEKHKEITLEALVHHLQSLAARCSVLFIVEDAHWIDPTTRDLLTRIIDHIQQIRMLLGVVQLVWVTQTIGNRPPGKGGFDAEMKKTGRVSNRFRVQLKKVETL
jgi:predicted ATPase